jgi:hypothetical protein
VRRRSSGKTTQAQVVQAGSRFTSWESPWLTFGLGKYKHPKITVAWPSGLRETFAGNPAHKVAILVESNGSYH